MEVKFGKIRPNSANIFMPSFSSSSDVNFFASNPEHKEQEKKQELPANGNRINDYDSNILEKNAYQNLPDEMLKLEYKMNILEQNLAKILEDIETLQSLGYASQVSELEERKQKIINELSELNKEYSNLGLSARISGQLTTTGKFKVPQKKLIFSKLKKFFFKNILSKISKKFDYNQKMKEALGKLSSINSSVNELITLQTPYGETVNRYEKLTAYLNKANVIHSEISKNLNTKKVQ